MGIPNETVTKNEIEEKRRQEAREEFLGRSSAAKPKSRLSEALRTVSRLPIHRA
jgi:hypothetical protein